jgi:lipopolysaccharide assembly protein A
MIRFFRYLLLVVLAICLLTVATANRTPVVVRALPEDMGLFMGFTWAMELPLFLVIFGGIIAGLLIGFVWEWARESKHRSAATTHSREVARLEREVTRLRASTAAEPEDDVLALLDAKRKVG